MDEIYQIFVVFELSFTSMGLFVGSWSSMIFHLLLLHTVSMVSFILGAFSEVVFEFE